MKKIEVQGASVDFHSFVEDGVLYYHFDSSMLGPPEPMVNAMCGLKLLDEKSKLIMINHKPPAGLFPKIEQDFSYELFELEDGKYKIVFSKKEGPNTTDFSASSCSGGSC